MKRVVQAMGEWGDKLTPNKQEYHQYVRAALLAVKRELENEHKLNASILAQVNRFKPMLAAFSFVVVAILLHRELSTYHLRDIRLAISQISANRVFPAVGLVGFNYCLIISYDVLALRSLAIKLPLHKICIASVSSYIASINLGATLGGTVIRYRAYSALGLSALEIMKLCVILTTTSWAGFSTLAGIVLWVHPLAIPPELHLPIDTTRPIAGVLLIFTALYLLSNILHGKLTERLKRLVPLPGVGVALLQIIVSASDFAVAGAMLYILLPSDVHTGYFQFLPVFLLAVAAAAVTHIPGGLGVFELVILSLLTPAHSAAIVGALLAYRVIYYLLPLAVLLAGFATQQLVTFVPILDHIVPQVRQIATAVVPRLISFAVFLAGSLLLFSSALPISRDTALWLESHLSLPISEVSHLLSSIAGTLLLVLARGLQRRMDSAYWATLALLIVGSVLALTKGLRWELSVAQLVIAAILVSTRRFFHRKGSLVHQPFTGGWIASIVLVVACMIWLGFFAHRHEEYSNDLWWTFSFTKDAPRFLRASLASVVVLLVFTANQLLLPVKPRLPLPTEDDLCRAAAIGSQSGHSEAFLVLLGDKYVVFSEDRLAFLMHSIQHRSWISMGDPIGPPEEIDELVWTFRNLCDCYGARPVFYQVAREHVPIYLDHGLSVFKIGEQARVNLADFSLAGGERKSLRQVHNRYAKLNFSFRILPSQEVGTRIKELQQISNSWLAAKKTSEKSFSIGCFEPQYIQRFPVAIVECDNTIIAFANVWAPENREQFTIDLMRHVRDAPAGIMDHLFLQLIDWGKRQGYRYFSLGMAPLAGLDARPLAPFWHKAGGLLFQHGEHFYNFEGLRQYKEKFRPEWKAKYIAAPGGIQIALILRDIATLISGGVKGLLMK